MAAARRNPDDRTASKLSPEILDRLPPNNLDAEKGLLGSLLIDPAIIDDLLDSIRLHPEEFYSESNRKLFAHLVGLRDEGGRIDMTLLVERLKRHGDFEAVGGAAYLAEVAQSVPVAAHAPYYAKIVREKATLRELIHASTDILRDAWDPTIESRDVLNRAEEIIFGINDRRSGESVKPIKDVLLDTFDQIDARMRHGSSMGVPSGFTDLDNLTGGLHDSELVILAARPSMGKTAMATNIAEHVAIRSRKPTLFISLEMARIELAQRMLCSQGRIDAQKLRKGQVSAEDHKKLLKASNELSQSPLFIDDTPSRTTTEIAACARRIKRKDNLGLIVIDYLQLIEPDNPKDPRQEQVAKIARRLKALARELEVPVLCLAQLNRQADATKEGPRLSHLRESGAIEQDADVVMFIHREEYGQTDEDVLRQDVHEADVIVAKQRNGPIGTIKLAWFKRFTRFEDLQQKPYDEFESFGGADGF